MYRYCLLLLMIFTIFEGKGQAITFTHQDSLRGSVTLERAWWDLIYYHLSIQINPLDSSITGSNQITYRVLQPYQRMQIDLQPPLEISTVIQNQDTVSFIRDGNVFYLDLPTHQKKDDVNSLIIYYGGKPTVAERPPWDGGITWAKDENDHPFISTSCQGEGASLWWPCKDHLYDEPDSVLISVTIPDPLVNVSNGRLRAISHPNDSMNTSHWFVSNPINNYSVSFNVGDYVHFGEQYNGLNGKLDCEYYVLRDNLEKATLQFKQVPMMLEAFEYWFGPYPFYEDGYKLVEAPYLGMEHQSAVAYGNLYTNGYWGTDLSGTGWGKKFDYIIVHESGHEWFGNNITVMDLADLWVHEGFSTYAESLFLEYHYGKVASNAYILGLRSGIQNRNSLIGPYNVNHMNTYDMYSKGANMLHMIRQLLEDDEEWRNILIKLNKEFYHQTVSSKQVEEFLCRETKKDLTSFFNQYLRDTRIPELEYQLLDKKEIQYRYTNTVEGFEMPIKISLNGKWIWLTPAKDWKSYTSKRKIRELYIDPNFYILPVELDSKY